MRTSSDGGEHRKVSEAMVNSNGAEENSTARQSETASEDNSEIALRNQEQHSAPKVRQSFSWLVDTPVVLTTNGKEQKAKGKRCVEGREKANSMLKYANGKYLKSCQHLSEIPPSNSKGQPQLSVASGSSLDSSGKHSKYCKSEDGCLDSGKERKEELKANQGIPGHSRRRDVVPSTSGFRVGFGADGKQASISPTAKNQTI